MHTSYKHLSIKQRESLFWEKVNRIPTHRLIEIESQISDCQSVSKIRREPQCMYIRGLAGSGKTELLKQHLKKNPRRKSEDGRLIIPALYVEVPPKATPKSLASTILEEFGDPGFTHGNTQVLTSRIIKYIEHCEVEIIMLDEFHHFIDRRWQVNDASEYLKSLINRTKVATVIAGMPDADIIFFQNKQLASRFSIWVTLHYFRFDIAFLKFLKMLGERIPIEEPPKLEEIEMAFRLFSATQGCPRVIVNLTCEAYKNALRESRERMILSDFAKAYQSYKPFLDYSFFQCDSKNPFEIDINEVEIMPIQESTDYVDAMGKRINAKPITDSEIFSLS